MLTTVLVFAGCAAIAIAILFVWSSGAPPPIRDDIPPQTMTETQLIADTIEVTRYLRERFDQEKIYLMGHSGGTFLAIQVAAKAPELYHAYMVEEFRRTRDDAMARKLEAAPVSAETGTPNGYLVLRDRGMHSLGIATMRDTRSVAGSSSRRCSAERIRCARSSTFGAARRPRA